MEPLLAIDDLVDVVEVEPQIFWAETGDPLRPYRCDPVVESHLDAVTQRKSVHSVGCAVGGSKAPHPANVAVLAEAIGSKFAVETGVNYLAPQPGQISDGAYVAAVVEQACCGILLDLHNVWTNERNGRQPVRDFVAELPLDRVWELHVAGGHEHSGYWLDAHSGTVPEPVLDLLAEIVPKLPSLRLVTFEIVPEFVAPLGLRGLREQVEAVRRACAGDHRRVSIGLGCPGAQRMPDVVPVDGPEPVTPERWENALGAEVIGRTAEDSGVVGTLLRSDPGSALLRELVEEGRAGALAGALTLSIRLLLLSLGSVEVRRIMARFWHEKPPEPFASTEALGFARYLHHHWPGVAYLDEVLSFETAVIESLAAGERRSVTFRHDPAQVLGPLSEGKCPDVAECGEFIILVGAGAMQPGLTHLNVSEGPAQFRRTPQVALITGATTRLGSKPPADDTSDDTHVATAGARFGRCPWFPPTSWNIFVSRSLFTTSWPSFVNSKLSEGSSSSLRSCREISTDWNRQAQVHGTVTHHESALDEWSQHPRNFRRGEVGEEAHDADHQHELQGRRCLGGAPSRHHRPAQEAIVSSPAGSSPGSYPPGLTDPGCVGRSRIVLDGFNRLSHASPATTASTAIRAINM